MQRTKDNSVVPYQVHKEELVKILDNASKYYSFLNEKDDSGYSEKEKIILILEFRRPYYVGPLNTAHKVEDGGYAWAVRKEGMNGVKVTPWNFDKVIDESASAEEFIKNLTNKCTYLKEEDVLPKNSLLYSEFVLLNELNALRYEGQRLNIQARNIIIEKLFKQEGKKVTKKAIKDLLKIEGLITGEGEIIGIDGTIKNDLKSYRDFKAILGEKFDNVRVENIIRWITLYGETTNLIKDKISKEYGTYYTVDEIEKMSRLRYKEWGRLSLALLTEIVSEKLYNEDTGECLNIIGAMRQNTVLFMELLADNLDYSTKIAEFNKKLEKEITKITPEILDDLYVSPAVKRSIWQTIKIVEELKKIIGSAPTKIFVETTKSNKETKGDAGRKDARKKALEALYKNIKDKEIVELEKEINKTIDFSILKNKLENEEATKLKAKKLYLYYTQLGRCMYTGEKISIEGLLKNNEYDIDHIYPRSKIKDDSFTNTVLVKRVNNAKKSDEMIPTSYQTQKNKTLWRFLKEKKLITEEKYNRLVRTEEFSDEELTGFIARQLVETSQAIKAVSSILEELNPKTIICYPKAENSSDFRKNFGKILKGKKDLKKSEELVKVREINNFHHAYDAYLSIVVGNVYDVKFSRNAYNFIKNNKDSRKYSLNKMFYEDVKNSKEVAWEMNKTVHVVEKMMKNKNILVTRRTSEQKGALYDATVYTAKKAANAKPGVYYPLKTNDDKISDVTKYGGFTKIKIAYYSVFEYKLIRKKDIQKLTRIIPIPVYVVKNIQSDEELVNYAQSQLVEKSGEEIRDLKLIYKKIRIGDLIRINNWLSYMGGKTNENFTYDSAVQVILDNDSEKYIKKIAKYLNWKKENKEGTLWEDITKENNVNLYNALVEKMNTSIFTLKKLNKYEELVKDDTKAIFKKLSEEEQAKVLLEILNTMTELKTVSNLKALNINVSRSKQTFNLTELKQFSVIEQSVTGFYEKEVTIIEESDDDMENSSN